MGGAGPAAPPQASPCRAEFAWDGDGDGVPDGVGVDVLDDQGRVTGSTRDWDLDGLPDEVERWLHAEHGPVRREAGDVVETWAYDDLGRQIQAITEDTRHGTRRVVQQGWLDASRRLWRTQDLDGDGLVDASTTWRYDEAGALVAEEEDTDGDSQVDAWTTFRYDDLGRRVRAEKDVQGDGTVEVVDETVYDGPTGRSGVTVTINRDVLTAEVVERYDALDRLVYVRRDDGPIDDVPTLEQTITYDEGGRATAWKGVRDVGAEAPLPFATVWTRDGLGRLVAVTAELDGLVERSTWRYTCR